jgi:hypothetical protein
MASRPKALAASSQTAALQSTIFSTRKSNGGIFMTTLKGYIAGLITGNSTSNLASNIDILSGEAASDDASPIIMPFNDMTKKLDVTFEAGHNKGGLRSGLSKVADAWYATWGIAPESGVGDVMFDNSFTSPALPGGFTRKRLIGAVQTDPWNSIRRYRQMPDGWFLWQPRVDLYPNGQPIAAATPILLYSGAPPLFGTKVKVTLMSVSSAGQMAIEIMDGFTTQAGFFDFHSAAAAMWGSKTETVYTDQYGRIKAYANIAGTLYVRSIQFKLPTV